MTETLEMPGQLSDAEKLQRSIAISEEGKGNPALLELRCEEFEQMLRRMCKKCDKLGVMDSMPMAVLEWWFQETQRTKLAQDNIEDHIEVRTDVVDVSKLSVEELQKVIEERQEEEADQVVEMNPRSLQETVPITGLPPLENVEINSTSYPRASELVDKIHLEQTEELKESQAAQQRAVDEAMPETKLKRLRSRCSQLRIGIKQRAERYAGGPQDELTPENDAACTALAEVLDLMDSLKLGLAGTE